MKKYKVNGNSERQNISIDNSNFRSSAAQILAVCIKNTLMLALGMSMGFPTILIPGLQEPNSRDSFNLSQEAISWIGSIHLICVPVGSIVSGPITQILGRKRTMQLVNIPFLCVWVMFSYATSAYVIFIALCITGLTGGLLEAPVITYVSEICQPRLRGILSATSGMAVITGIFIQFLFGAFLPWRTVSLVNCAFPILSFALLCFVPESPHWLVMKKRLVDARKSIAWLRGWTTLEAIEPEFIDLCKCLESDANNFRNQNKSQHTTWENIQLYTKKNFLWPYAIVCICFMLSQVGGMTTLQTYAVQIFASLRTPIDNYVATVYLGTAELIGCTICTFLVHKLGKRMLSFVSTVGCGICYTIVATYAYCNGINQLITPTASSANVTNIHEATNSVEDYSWIPLVFLVLSALLSYMGIRILPWLLIGELYSNETRAAASGFSAATGYIFGFLTNKTFLSLTGALTLPGMFWCNSAGSFIGCILLYVLLPETEGKPLWEITDHFNGGKKMRNSVRKKHNNSATTQSGKINDGFRLDNLDKEANVESL